MRGTTPAGGSAAARRGGPARFAAVGADAAGRGRFAASTRPDLGTDAAGRGRSDAAACFAAVGADAAASTLPGLGADAAATTLPGLGADAAGRGRSDAAACFAAVGADAAATTLPGLGADAAATTTSIHDGAGAAVEPDAATAASAWNRSSWGALGANASSRHVLRDAANSWIRRFGRRNGRLPRPRRRGRGHRICVAAVAHVR